MPTFRDDIKLGTKVPQMKTDDYNDQSVTERKIRDGSVTTRKLADEAVTKDKLDKELLKIIEAASGLPEDIIETIQNVNLTLSDHQKQLDDKQAQITSNDRDIDKLQKETDKINDTIKNITTSGGASVASAVSYNNVESGLNATNVQAAVDELETKKFDKSNVAQTTGSSTLKVMSQKTVTDELAGIKDTTNAIFSILAENSFNVSLDSSRGWSFRYSEISKVREDGTYKDFTTLSVSAKWYADDVTDKISNVSWTRNSGSKELDEVWNKAHADAMLSIPISFEDLGANIYRIGHVNFTCEAEYNKDGEVKRALRTITF